jgi:large subunit ribosomal protein L9
MKVILTEKVKALGNIGEVVRVSAGFGRNYLIPNKLAVLADEGNKKNQIHLEKMLAKKVAAEKNAALEAKKKIDSLSLEFVKRVGASGKLFGMVTNADLARELELRDVHVERRVITVDNPIKSLGSYDVKVKLFKDVEAQFKVKVTLDPEQAEEMKKKQELAAKKKEQDKAEAEARAASGEEAPQEVELTEEQRLKAEADRLLRG